ncbi:S1C family serine protease [Paenibacillus daejeonensis]|uniref:S1C family serine protease n=1 Tax=Paenibacillus daejeonensis TaxID=135193 RepID=UPI00037EFBE1|nr:S1C family serine protease [Paenibacillus daejeonensis]
MKKWFLIILSLMTLTAGSGGLYYLHERWSNPVAAAESPLGRIMSEEQTSEGQSDLKEMIRNHQKQVVSIQTVYDDGSGIGSGFLYNDRGDIVTNAHVVSGAKQVKIKMSDTSLYKGKVIGIHEERDIALVRVEELAGKTPIAVDSETKADIGDEVLAFGSPLGLENTVTTGIISGVDRDLEIDQTKYVGVYQISAPIAGGNSGGPLVMKSTGKVIGINSAGTVQGQIGFSIPYHQVADMLENWSNNPDQSLANDSSDDTALDAYTAEYIAEDSSYLLYYFYESLNNGDYVTAYSLLGSDWQTKTSYAKFREGYLNTSSVSVTSLHVGKSTASSAEVNLIIEAWETRQGERILSSYSQVYQVKLENDSLKIVSGTGKKL